MSPDSPGALMRAEIAEQPAVLARLLAERARAGEVGELLRRTPPRFVLLAARGTSDHAALYAKYLIEIGLGIPAGLASPSTLTVYGAQPDLRDVLLVAVSQSGGSPDLVETARRARACGARVLAVTNAPGSELAAVDLHVDVLAGPERAVAATKSYSAELLALWLVVAAWRGEDLRRAEGVAAEAADHLRRREEVAVLAGHLAGPLAGDRLVCTARGYSYATAREAALKLMETAYLSAHAFSGADLMHGPIAMISRDLPVLAVAPAGAGAEALAPVLASLRARGADLAVLGASAAREPGEPGYTLRAVDEDLAPITDIVPLQLLALEIALARDLDPDQPRGLRKVTRTW
jgi:glucosamine--fructose-6-phosphate aminotransferase (isomerizing)